MSDDQVTHARFSRVDERMAAGPIGKAMAKRCEAQAQLWEVISAIAIIVAVVSLCAAPAVVVWIWETLL